MNMIVQFNRRYVQKVFHNNKLIFKNIKALPYSDFIEDLTEFHASLYEGKEAPSLFSSKEIKRLVFVLNEGEKEILTISKCSWEGLAYFFSLLKR